MIFIVSPRLLLQFDMVRLGFGC